MRRVLFLILAFSSRGEILEHAKAGCGERFVDGNGWQQFLGSVHEVGFSTGNARRLCVMDESEKIPFQDTAASCSFSVEIVDSAEGWLRLRLISGLYMTSSRRGNKDGDGMFRLMALPNNKTEFAIEDKDTGMFMGERGLSESATAWTVSSTNRSTRRVHVSTVARRRRAARCSHSTMRFDDNATILSLDHALASSAKDRPPVIILGVGHSGTSSVAHHFIKRGWAPPVLRPGVKLEKSKAEDYKVLVHNNHFVQATRLDKAPVDSPSEAEIVADRFQDAGQCWVDKGKLTDVWRAAAKPVVWKDPQFVWTLHLWAPLLQPPPLLVHVRRDPTKIIQSHKVRGETLFKHLNMSIEKAVRARIAWADWQLQQWCGPSISFNVGSLKNVEVKNHHPASATENIKAAAAVASIKANVRHRTSPARRRPVPPRRLPPR